MRLQRLWAILAVALACALFGAGPALSQRVYIDITQPNFTRIPIAVPEFKLLAAGDVNLARQMAETLSADLDYSGFFRPLDPRGFLQNPQQMGMTAPEISFPAWKQSGAEFLVRGGFQLSGGAIRMEMRLFDVVAGKEVIAKAYDGTAQEWRAIVHRFADEILLALTGERGVFGTKIAFVNQQGNVKEIFVCDFDGSNPIQVTNDRSIALSPAWNPAGNRMAYVSYRDGAAKIYVMNLLDGSVRLLSGQPGLNITPAWRPGGGDELAATLSKDGTPDIYLLTASGQVVQRLVQGWSIDVSPAWSPDGRRLAFVSSETGNPQIYVLDLATGQKRRITFSGTYNTAPSWSPKGDLIAYSGISGGRHEVFVVRPEGGEPRQLTQGGGEDPSFSPDGRMIAYSSTREGGAAIWVMLVNGTGARRVTRMAGEQTMPDWSPRLTGGR